MRSLFALHDQPRLCAPLMADIHLRPCLMAACKIASTATYYAAPLDVQIQKNLDNMREYMYRGISILPPYPGPNPWVAWARSSYHRFWWVVEMAWWIDKELQHRFHVDQSPVYVRLNKIVEEGVSRHFPKPEYKDIHTFPSPTPIAMNGDEITQYRVAYKNLSSKVRMKWTNREVPAFMAIKASICPDCGAPAPTNGACDVGCYYSKN